METVLSDLTVAGGGIAGMCAAIAAARHGLKVALINDRPVLGGNASSEVAVSISGAASGGGSRSVYARETGIVEEIKLERLFYNQMAQVSHSYQDWPMEDATYFNMIYNEPNIRLFLNTSVRSAKVENGKIKFAEAVQLGSEKSYCFESPLFADCTGDGTLGYEAGAEYMWGEEAKSEFNEHLAPDRHTNIVMGSTLLLFSRDAGQKAVYKRPSFAYDITKTEFFDVLGKDSLARGIHRGNGVYMGYWWIEIGGLNNTITENEEITLELRKIVYGLWDYIKNSGKFEGVENLLLDKVTCVPGKRESRRFIGDIIVTENDVEDKTEYGDAVSIGGWSMDVHAPFGIYDKGPASQWHPNNGIYNLPFRALYSKNIPNLLFAGRDVSCTHIAMGSTRVMGTCACMGQAVGTAAALCKKYDEVPAQIAQSHIPELQSLLLKDDQTIMGYKDPVNKELYRDIHISASSVQEVSNENGNELLSLEWPYCITIPIREKLDTFEIRIKNSSSKAKMLRLSVYGGTRPENYIPQTFIKDTQISIPENYDGWIPVDISTQPLADQKLYLLFAAAPELHLYCTDKKLVGIVSFLCKNNEQTGKYPKAGPFFLHRLERNICFRNLSPSQSLYGAENLLNGYSRPYGLPNIWASNKEVDSYIQLSWDSPSLLSELHLVFDTCLEYDNFNEMMPDLIKDYTIELILADNSKKDITVRDNHHRVAKHKLNVPVKALKILLERSYGCAPMQMYAINLY